MFLAFLFKQPFSEALDLFDTYFATVALAPLNLKINNPGAQESVTHVLGNLLTMSSERTRRERIQTGNPAVAVRYRSPTNPYRVTEINKRAFNVGL